jgi:pilus assembly protein CpaC
VINLLWVGGNAQVMLEVKIAEMNRSIRRQFGSNMEGLFGSGRNQFQLSSFVRNLTDLQGPFQAGRMTGMGRMLSVADDTRLVASLVRGDSLVLSMFLEALEVTQLGRVLAEPTLVARSGELASFLVGGEIPIPVPQDDDSITIEFKRFGVQLEFVPTVLSADRIHLQVTPEVSQPTQAFGGFQRNGVVVPAFRTRRAATGVELADGQSFAIGGLLQEGVQSDFDRIPFLAELPILGQMFRSQRFMRDETEMVMIVTPKLVQPLGPDPLPLPGDSYVEPTRLDLLLGRIEGTPRSDNGVIRRDEDPLKGERGSQTKPAPDQGEKAGLLGEFGHRLGIPQPVGEDS